jgi:hypothetical protein
MPKYNRNSQEKLEWIKFDTATLPEDLHNLLTVFRELESKANAAKREFNTGFMDALVQNGYSAPAGQKIVITLNFDDVGFAYVEKGSTKSSVERVGFNTKTVMPTATRGKNRLK